MIEVEVKAWDADPQKTIQNVKKIASFAAHIVKCDTYWQQDTLRSAAGQQPVQVRIRSAETNQHSENIVTYKEQQKSGGIEVNKEHEFLLPEREPFEVILKAAGFSVYSTKEKHTDAYNAPLFKNIYQCTIELSDVRPLGRFIEIEILLPDNSPQPCIDEARNHILTLMDVCGIPKTAIEEKYYNQLLRERTAKV